MSNIEPTAQDFAKAFEALAETSYSKQIAAVAEKISEVRASLPDSIELALISSSCYTLSHAKALADLRKWQAGET